METIPDPPALGSGVIKDLTEAVFLDTCSIDVRQASFPVKLDLSHDGFMIKSANGLGKLPTAALKEVDISNNAFESTEVFDRFPSIDVFVAPRNQIASFTLKAAKLVRLDLSGNKLSQFPNLRSMVALKYLDLSKNKLAGNWECLWQNGSALEELYVGHNNLSWKQEEFVGMASHLTTCKRLKTLDLAWNPFVALVTHYRLCIIGQADGLVKLDDKSVTTKERLEKLTITPGTGGSKPTLGEYKNTTFNSSQITASTPRGESEQWRDAAEKLTSEVADEMMKRKRFEDNRRTKDRAKEKTSRTCESLTAEITRIKEEISQLRTELDQCNEERAQVEEMALKHGEQKDSMGVCSGTLKTLTKQCEEKRKERSQLQNELGKTQDKMKGMKKQIAKEDAYLAQSLQELENVRNDARHFRQHTEANKLDGRSRDESLANCVRTVQDFKTKAQKLKDVFAASTAKRAAAERAELKLMKAKEALNKEVEEAEREVRETEAKWTPEIALAKQTELDLKSELADLKLSEKETGQKSTDLQTQEDSLQKEKARLLPENEQLQQLLKKTRSEYAESVTVWNRRATNAGETLRHTTDDTPENALKWLAAGFARKRQDTVQTTTQHGEESKNLATAVLDERKAHDEMLLAKEDEMDNKVDQAFEGFKDEVRKVAGEAVDGIDKLWTRKCREVSQTIEKCRSETDAQAKRLREDSPYGDNLDLQKVKLEKDLSTAKLELTRAMKDRAVVFEAVEKDESVLYTERDGEQVIITALAADQAQHAARHQSQMEKWKKETEDWRRQASWWQSERDNLTAECDNLRSGTAEAEEEVIQDIESSNKELEALEEQSRTALSKFLEDRTNAEKEAERVALNVNTAKDKLAGFRQKLIDDTDSFAIQLESKAAEHLAKSKSETEAIMASKKALSTEQRDAQKADKAKFEASIDKRRSELHSRLVEACAPFQRELDAATAAANAALDKVAATSHKNLADLVDEVSAQKATMTADHKRIAQEREESNKADVATEQSEVTSIEGQTNTAIVALEDKQAELKKLFVTISAQADAEQGGAGGEFDLRIKAAEAAIVSLEEDTTGQKRQQRELDGKASEEAAAAAQLANEQESLNSQLRPLDSQAASVASEIATIRDQIVDTELKKRARKQLALENLSKRIAATELLARRTIAKDKAAKDRAIKSKAATNRLSKLKDKRDEARSNMSASLDGNDGKPNLEIEVFIGSLFPLSSVVPKDGKPARIFAGDVFISLEFHDGTKTPQLPLLCAEEGTEFVNEKTKFKLFCEQVGIAPKVSSMTLYSEDDGLNPVRVVVRAHKPSGIVEEGVWKLSSTTASNDWQLAATDACLLGHTFPVSSTSLFTADGKLVTGSICIELPDGTKVVVSSDGTPIPGASMKVGPSGEPIFVDASGEVIPDDEDDLDDEAMGSASPSQPTTARPNGVGKLNMTGGGGGKGGGADTSTEFKALDKNGDGTLSVDELKAMAEKGDTTAAAFLAQADKDGSGTIDVSEFAQARGGQSDTKLGVGAGGAATISGQSARTFVGSDGVMRDQTTGAPILSARLDASGNPVVVGPDGAPIAGAAAASSTNAGTAAVAQADGSVQFKGADGAIVSGTMGADGVVRDAEGNAATGADGKPVPAASASPAAASASGGGAAGAAAAGGGGSSTLIAAADGSVQVQDASGNVVQGSMGADGVVRSADGQPLLSARLDADGRPTVVDASGVPIKGAAQGKPSARGSDPSSARASARNSGRRSAGRTSRRESARGQLSRRESARGQASGVRSRQLSRRSDGGYDDAFDSEDSDGGIDDTLGQGEFLEWVEDGFGGRLFSILEGEDQEEENPKA